VITTSAAMPHSSQGLDGFELIPHIVRAVVQGEPVALQKIAAAANLPTAEAERLLRSQPGTEWDDDGRLVGFGLTSRPTDHRFSVEGKTLYTWCATDTLFFTVILGRSTVVESTCPATGQLIRIELDPDAVISIEPKNAVVSQRHHGELVADVRAQVCDHGHFFASSAAASTWMAEHPRAKCSVSKTPSTTDEPPAKSSAGSPKSPADERAKHAHRNTVQTRPRGGCPRPDPPRSRLPTRRGSAEPLGSMSLLRRLNVAVEEVEGSYSSPTLLINGADVTGHPAVVGPSCRLDVPTEEEILIALTRAQANP